MSKRKRRDVLSLLRRQVEAATKAAKVLSQHEDLSGRDVLDISGFNREWLEQSILVHTDAVKSNGVLTASEREKHLEKWRNIKKTASAQIGIIQHMLNDWPEVKWQRGDDGLFFVSSAELERVCLLRSTIELPPIVLEHWQRAQDVLKSIKAFRQWEHANNFTHPRLAVLANYNEYQFFVDSVDGMFSFSAISLRYRQEPNNDEFMYII